MVGNNGEHGFCPTSENSCKNNKTLTSSCQHSTCHLAVRRYLVNIWGMIFSPFSHASTTSPQPAVNTNLLQIKVQVVYFKGKHWSMQGVCNKKFRFSSTMKSKLVSSWPIAIPFQKPTGNWLTPVPLGIYRCVLDSVGKGVLQQQLVYSWGKQSTLKDNCSKKFVSYFSVNNLRAASWLVVPQPAQEGLCPGGLCRCLPGRAGKSAGWGGAVFLNRFAKPRMVFWRVGVVV